MASISGIVAIVVVGVLALVALTVLGLAIWVIVVRNGLVAKRTRAEEALHGIDVALEARFDQITAQKNVVTGAVRKEVDLIMGATAMRTGRPVGDLSVTEKAQLTDAMQKAERVMLTAEAYPSMNSLENVQLLQRTINEAEERLQASRRLYNAQATEFNVSRQMFPQNIVARVLSLPLMDLFEVSAETKRDPVDLEGFLG